MNNLVQFVCLWCCVLPDFVVQINILQLGSIFRLIHKRRGKKLISKTIKYKFDSSSIFFILKTFKNFFRKTITFAKNLKLMQIARGWGVGVCPLHQYDAMHLEIKMIHS